MPDDAATHQIRFVGNQPVAAPVLHQLCIPRHGSEAALERLLFERLNIEQFHQASEFEGRTLCCEGFQDVFAARQRVIVLRFFAFELRIGASNF